MMKMNCGRSDASTSTEDIRGRPLCLFYFTHPFGVLSPDPPTITAAPANISQAFINMEPVSPYNFWSSTTTQESYNTSPTSSSKVSYDVGNVLIPKKPINLASVPKYTVDFNLRHDSVSSSLFSSDIWLSGSSSDARPRRIVPCNRILPPLALPTPNFTESSDEFWTGKSYVSGKVSLPPIDLPNRNKTKRRKVSAELFSDDSVKVEDNKCRKVGRVFGVKKARARVKLSGIRRMVNCLMQRAVRGRKDLNSSPALQEVLNTIREAWAEPKSLLERCRALSRTLKAGTGGRERGSGITRDNKIFGDNTTANMLKRSQLAELSRPGASPGLMRRRYSMPETIMRKYRLAQQRSDSDDSIANTAPSRAASPASPSPPRGSCASLCEPPHRFMRRDRELMRKSALLRRLWARPNPCPSCCCCSGDLCDSQADCGRETRSLDGSRSELRHLSGSLSSSRYSKESHMLAGWATPKRQRLDSPSNFHSSDEMIRTAMRNSYDRAEELRHEKEVQNEMSDSTFQSHDPNHILSINNTTSSDTQFTESSKSNNSRNTDESSDGFCSECITAQVASERHSSEETEATSKEYAYVEEQQYSQESENSISIPTVKENIEHVTSNKETSRYRHINLQISEEAYDIENNTDTNVQLNKSSPKEAPYEVLEIVVSETLNSSAFEQASKLAIKNSSPRKIVEDNHKKLPLVNKKDIHGIDLDEYVSNILVESLNSLTDQIENMNASIGSDRKISIVEKEIKVKLQNTGVNTIVHLSPTSNNQIIFGNAELYNKDDKDVCNDKQEQNNSIRKGIMSLESNNNYTNLTNGSNLNEYSNKDVFTENYEPIVPHETVNKSVLQQIQKLFQDEMQNIDLENYEPNSIPGISHIEISNVDVFVEENTNPETIVTDDNGFQNQYEYHPDIISSVGSGNYYHDFDEPVLVPRFSALPHSESMEVNTSSSEDVDIMGSECPSLVDSLDDPNSPRSILQKRSYPKRSELVRSAIDVLDLLPESASGIESHPKEKSESFFIRIKDDNCDCEKENIIVAEHMPDKIRERLYRRHKKRELRMECAKRKKIKQYKRELEKLRTNEAGKSKKEIEKECMAIVNALVNEVIAKIAHDEYKCMRIKQNSNFKSNDLLTSHKKSTWNTKADISNKMNTSAARNDNKNIKEKLIKSKNRQSNRICGKLSLQTHPLMESDEHPKRIYQKSEIREGNKCIEILEILEYVDSSQSSAETTNSDENINSNRNRKSKIPVPIISERMKKSFNSKNGRPYKSSPILNYIEAYDSNLNDIILNESYNDLTSQSTRRASVPHETRSRSNSLRFKQVFDIIPEEKSSLSIESPSEDINYNRRVSAPNLSGNFVENNNNDTLNKVNDDLCKNNDKQDRRSPPKKENKSIGTSPFSESSDNKIKSPVNSKNNKNVTTSPIKKSIATSPILLKIEKDAKPPTNSAKKSLSSHGTRAGWLGFYKPNKQVLENEGLKDNKSREKRNSKDRDSVTQIDIESNLQSTVRTLEIEKAEPIVIGKDKHRNRNENSRESKVETAKQKESKKRITEKVTDAEVKDRKKVFKDCSLVRSLSDPQNDIVWKSNKKNVSCVEKSEEDTCPKSVKLPNAYKDKNPDLSTSESDTDSGKSLLCSLAPKWLSVGNMRQKRQVRKKASQDHQSQQSSAGGWSVTVAGNCYTALPADVEMRLSFPKAATNQITSQSDSGFGDENRVRRPIAAAPKGCHCRHCDNCTCSYRKEEGNSYAPILPPAQKMTVIMKKESSGSSILTSKSTKKSSEPLPDLETFKSSRSKTKSSVKMQRGFSLHCWLPGDTPPPITNSNGLSVLGSAIIPEAKPRVPTMSERDLTRTYTPRHYLRS